jgi:hypothetical protein
MTESEYSATVRVFTEPAAPRRPPPPRLARGTPDPNATLRGAAIWFQTGNDDKDGDTGVVVSVQDQDGAEVAAGSIPYGGFPDGYTSPMFPLQVTNDSTYDLVSNGQMTITINPNGHDHWVFNPHLRLRFSDHSHIVASAANVSLDQDHRTTVISLASPGG